MEKIEFRGKLSHSKQWVYGNLIIANNGDPYIIPFEVFEPDGHHLIIDSDNPFWVEPESVGQFTGLLDKNGKKIFEGDVIEEGVVYFDDEYLGFFVEGDFVEGERKPLYDIPLPEIIGNVHNNHELLK